VFSAFIFGVNVSPLPSFKVFIKCTTSRGPQKIQNKLFRGIEINNKPVKKMCMIGAEMQ